MCRQKPSKTTTIVIVGLGPRGLSVLERLCANAVEGASGGELLIHVVDPHVLVGSNVWQVDQAPQLLMNTVSCQVTMFSDKSVECEGPVVPGPSLYEWAQSIALGSGNEGQDHTPGPALPEAARLGPDSYPSRAFYGQYLAWVLKRLMHSTPDNVRIELHARQATDVTDTDDGSQVVTLSDGEQLRQIDAIVLAQGHIAMYPTTAEATQSGYARVRGLYYIAPGNPADAHLAPIGPGQPTAMRGLGLNFFDYLALLTVGRGGSFAADPDGHLTYCRSGREPRLIAGSRRGVPHHARGENQKGPYGRHHPLFLTAAVIARLRDRAHRDLPADFRTEVWPLVDHEVRAIYYATLIGERSSALDVREFVRDYVALHDTPATTSNVPPADPLVYVTSQAEVALLYSYQIAADEHWDWHQISHPYPMRELFGNSGFRPWLLSYLDEDVRQAREGNLHSPIKAALDVMRDLRNEIRLIVDHGGLSGDSYRDDLQGWYTPLNAFVSIGPPARRIAEMIALIDSEVLTIVGPGMTVDYLSDDTGWRVGSTEVHETDFLVTALIEARLPDPDIRRTADPLIRNLLRRGECGYYGIPIRGGGHYETGGLAVTQRPYHLLDAAHHPHPRRFAFGVPTEAVHWATAAGIRPGVNSVILGDADSVARASLQTGGAFPPAGATV